MNDILEFIENFKNFTNIDLIEKQFTQKYCYYFATILKSAFTEGEICWVAPYAHFIYLLDDVPYDITGIYTGDADYIIPEKYLGDAILDFKHLKNKYFNASKDQINEIIEHYKSDVL